MPVIFLSNKILKTTKMEELLDLQKRVCHEVVKMHESGENFDGLLEMITKAISTGSSGENIQMDKILEMNVLVAKLMLNTESDKLQHLIKIQFVFNEVINGLEEANLKTMCNIALLLCESRKSKENECGGRESLERYIWLYKTTVEGILTSPDKKYMELLYRTCSGLFRGLRPLLMVMDENIAILLETVVELLPQNGNLSRASVLGLNQKMAGTLSSNKLTVNISEKLLHANSKLSSILEVHPDKIAVQAELLELNRLLIQAIRDTYPAKQLVGQLAIPLLAGIADIMIKFFGKMTRKRRIK